MINVGIANQCNKKVTKMRSNCSSNGTSLRCTHFLQLTIRFDPPTDWLAGWLPMINAFRQVHTAIHQRLSSSSNSNDRCKLVPRSLVIMLRLFNLIYNDNVFIAH